MTESYSTIPLAELRATGALIQADNQREVEVNIVANVFGTFFKMGGEWSCQRRNYVSCRCSFSLEGWDPSSKLMVSTPTDYVEVCGFAMTISAVASVEELPTTHLLQVNDKGGSTSTPEKAHIALNWGDAVSGECAFDRLQFEKATFGNGSRGSRQQYARIMIELMADIGSGQFAEVAHKMTEQFIVVGRHRIRQQDASISSIDLSPLKVSGDETRPVAAQRNSTEEVRSTSPLWSDVIYDLTVSF